MSLVKDLTEENGRQGEEIKRLTDRCVLTPSEKVLVACIIVCLDRHAGQICDE